MNAPDAMSGRPDLRRTPVSDEEENKKLSAKPASQIQPGPRSIQRKTERGTDGSDYVELTIPDGTYVLEAANIPADADWELTYNKYVDVYATASQYKPLVLGGLDAVPHLLRHSSKGVNLPRKFIVKPGAELSPHEGWSSAKVQAFRHNYVFDEDVLEARVRFDTVPFLDSPGKEEHVSGNVVDMDPNHHQDFSCPPEGKMSVATETSFTVTDGLVMTDSATINKTISGELTGKIGKKDKWEAGAKLGGQVSWGKTQSTAISEQESVTRKIQLQYACAGAGDFAFVPTCAVWKTPWVVNVPDRTGKRIQKDTAYLYRVKYNPLAKVCPVKGGKVDPSCVEETAAVGTTAAKAGKAPLDMSPDEFEKDQDAQYQLFTQAKSCRARMRALADEIMAQQEIKGGQADSILKRDSLPEFVKGVVDKCRRNGYKQIKQMDDIVRGRFDLRSKDDVNTVAAAMKGQSKYPAVLVVPPNRPLAGGGFGYPRWHIILSDPGSGLTHEWQIGTKAVTDVFEKPGVKLPDGVKRVCPGLRNDIHDVDFDIFRSIKKKYPDVHQRYGLEGFHGKVDAAAAEAGMKGDKTPDLAKKIAALHKEASDHFQKLVDEFGADWIKQFCHWLPGCQVCA
jgi:hypothetical protein